MRISELSAATGVSVATIKFYLREGILPAGRALSRTQAEYDQSHVQRIKLVRALIDLAELDLASVRRVTDMLDAPAAERIDVLATAQDVLGTDAEAERMRERDPHAEPSRARAWLDRRGWLIDPNDPLIDRLDRAWDAADLAQIGVGADYFDVYADNLLPIAALDMSSVPADPAGAVRQVVLGTLFMDPVLVTIRRLAHQHLAVSASGLTPDSAGDERPTA